MAFKKVLVIFVLTLVGITCAENSEPITSNSTLTTEIDSAPTPDNSSTSLMGNSSIPKAEISLTATTENITITTAPTSTAIATKIVCILIKLDMKFNDISYKISSDDVDKTVLTCSNQSATIRWGKTFNSRIWFNFTSDDKNNNYMMSDIILTIDATDSYMNATADKHIELVYKSNGNFKVPTGNSYKCSAVEIHFTGNGTSVMVTLSNVQLEAFRKSITHEFSSPMLCPNDQSSGLGTTGIVAISVICILLASIVLLVLWRKRNNLGIFGASAHAE